MQVQTQDNIQWKGKSHVLLSTYFLTAAPVLRGVVGYKLKGKPQWVRSSTALAVACVDFFSLSTMFAPAMRTMCGKEDPNIWNGLLVFWSLQYSNSLVGWFGGSEYYDAHGINSNAKAIMAALSPAQCYFPPQLSRAHGIDDDNSPIGSPLPHTPITYSPVSERRDDFAEAMKMARNKYRPLTRWDYAKKMGKFAMIILLGKAVHKLGKSVGLPFDENCKSISDLQLSLPNSGSLSDLFSWLKSTLWTFARTEAIAFHFAVLCYFQSIAYLSVGLFSGGDRVQLVEPWDGLSAVAASSMRDFWRDWSRPAGELLRYALFIPLGARKRPFLSTGAVFATNCLMHWEFSNNLVGQRDAANWTKSFALLGALTVSEMVAESRCSEKKEVPFWRKALTTATMHVSAGVALYWMRNSFAPVLNDSVFNEAYCN